VSGPSISVPVEVQRRLIASICSEHRRACHLRKRLVPRRYCKELGAQPRAFPQLGTNGPGPAYHNRSQLRWAYKRSRGRSQRQLPPVLVEHLIFPALHLEYIESTRLGLHISCAFSSPILARIFRHSEIESPLGIPLVTHYSGTVAQRPSRSQTSVEGRYMFCSRLAQAVFLFVGVTCMTACSSRFSQDDIARTETDIRTNFEQRGFTVEQVSLIKASDRQLSGFVKFRKSSGLFSKVELSKNCVCDYGCRFQEVYLGM
jgi:hypothetical protein